MKNINFESSRQLNWTNTFLWKKLGSINPILDQILEIPAITKNNKNQLKELAENCSEEYHDIKLEIAKIDNTQDLEKVKEQIRKYQVNFLDLIKNQDQIIKYIKKLEEHIKDLNKSLDRIQSCLGIREITSNHE